MFNFFKGHSTWQRDVISIFAKLSANYNSYYHRVYTFTEALLKKKINLMVSTQFFEARVRFKQNEMPVEIWELDRAFFQSLGFQRSEIYYSATATPSLVRIFIPAPLRLHFKELLNTLHSALENKASRGLIRRMQDVGLMTSSGRSLWLGWKPTSPLASPVCFKIDTLDILGVADFFNSRRLEPGDARFSTLINHYLEKSDFKNFFSEPVGLSIHTQDEAGRYVCLERFLDFKKTDVRKGDYIVPMQALLSDGFWAEPLNLSLLGFNKQSLQQIFEDHLAREFARLMKNSIENTFLHFEIHQQNLSCHFRSGGLQKILIHDLQDVLFDPLSFLFSTEEALWSEKISVIANFYRYRFFNFYGEPKLFIMKHTHYFVPSSFYRRYFRNFGNYTRIYNKSSGEDYLFSKKLETLVVDALQYSDLDLGITAEISSHPNYSLLRRNLFWVIARRIEFKQLSFIKKSFLSFKDTLQQLSTADIEALSLRAQREVCFYSANIPVRPENFPPKKIAHAYAAFKNHIYFLIFADGEMGSIVFIPTL